MLTRNKCFTRSLQICLWLVFTRSSWLVNNPHSRNAKYKHSWSPTFFCVQNIQQTLYILRGILPWKCQWCLLLTSCNRSSYSVTEPRVGHQFFNYPFILSFLPPTPRLWLGATWSYNHVELSRVMRGWIQEWCLGCEHEDPIQGLTGLAPTREGLLKKSLDHTFIGNTMNFFYCQQDYTYYTISLLGWYNISVTQLYRSPQEWILYCEHTHWML
jgi:hypothetical protein